MQTFAEYTAAMRNLRRATGVGYGVALGGGKATITIVTPLPNGTCHESRISKPMPFAEAAQIVMRASAAALAAEAKGCDRRAICAAVVAEYPPQ